MSRVSVQSFRHYVQQCWLRSLLFCFHKVYDPVGKISVLKKKDFRSGVRVSERKNKMRATGVYKENRVRNSRLTGLGVRSMLFKIKP